jgi:hypothetical protein
MIRLTKARRAVMPAKPPRSRYPSRDEPLVRLARLVGSPLPPPPPGDPAAIHRYLVAPVTLAFLEIFYWSAEQTYGRFGNPYYAWHVCDIAPQVGDETPEWAADVVRRMWRSVLDLRKATMVDIARATGLVKDKHNWVAEYESDRNAVEAVFKTNKTRTEYRRAEKRGPLLLVGYPGLASEPPTEEAE